MKFNCFLIKLNDKININLNKNKIIQLFKLSFGNNIIYLNYNKKKNESSNKVKKIFYYKRKKENNIGKMIYSNNTKNNEEIKLFDKEFLSSNIKRTKMILNNKQYKMKENIENHKQHFKIKIKFLDNIIKMNSMFKGCESLTSVINFQNINTKYLKTLYDLFNECNSLLYIDDISNWNISNINNINKLFFRCSSLENLPDISKWNTSNIINISCLFYCCSSLKYLPDISKWNTSKIIDMSNLFYCCSSLKYLPDISKWNISEITDMSNLFYCCSSLKFLPDISKWNISNAKNISRVDNGYYEFSTIESFYKINAILNAALDMWDNPGLKLSKSNNVFQPFGKDSLLNKLLLEISKKNPSDYLDLIINQFVGWKSLKSKYSNIYSMFYGCSSLESLPDISKWNIENIIDISGLFYECSSLKYIPDISKWNTSNIKNMSGLFYKCTSLEELPDISKWNTSNIKIWLAYLVVVHH